MDAEKPLYVTRLTKAKCSFGSMSQYLNLPLDHGVWFHDKETPIMNANDHEPDKHVLHFGRCTSSKNPSNMINMEDMILGMLFPLGGMFGSKMLKKLLGCEGCKCKPLTITPWKEVDEDYYIDGAPAITQNSYLNCYYGGKIEIDLSADGGEGDEKTDTEIEQRAYNSLQKMPASMSDKINAFCNGDGDSSSAFADVVSAGEVSSYGVSPQTSANNYEHNQGQSIPEGATDCNGNIVDQSAMGNYNIGNTTLAEQGDGVLAAYNILNMLSGTPNLADIIRFFEILPFVMGGNMLGGNAYGFIALLMYLMAQNLDVSVGTKTKKVGNAETQICKKEEKKVKSVQNSDRKKMAKKKEKVAVKGTVRTFSEGQRSVAKIDPLPAIVREDNSLERLEENELMILVGEKEDSMEEQQ
ncbi:MAG: DUF4280 domain-containing protein [Lachnospiraceae bacterium]|nr:DUF4280 domain-containing protein [Lachnospiraceae bacterium]